MIWSRDQLSAKKSKLYLDQFEQFIYGWLVATQTYQDQQLIEEKAVVVVVGVMIVLATWCCHCPSPAFWMSVDSRQDGHCVSFLWKTWTASIISQITPGRENKAQSGAGTGQSIYHRDIFRNKTELFPQPVQSTVVMVLDGLLIFQPPTLQYLYIMITIILIFLYWVRWQLDYEVNPVSLL